MRITGGMFKGRTFERPKTSSVRPMTDKERQAIFDIIGSVEDMKVVDAYAGSGAIGFESLSRGARSVVAIELNQTVAKLIDRNARELGFGSQHQVVDLPVEKWMAGDQTFDLIVAAPPFVAINDFALNHLATSLTNEGILVVSHTSRVSSPELKSLELVKFKRYGDASLSFYRKM